MKTTKYLQYLKKQKQIKRYIVLIQLALIIIVLAFWEIASRTHLIDPLIFSSPSKIWILLEEKIQDHSLYIHLRITLYETIVGFILGTLGGIVFAAILWTSTTLSRILDPYLVIFNAMPKVALGPILIVLLGPGMTSVIAMGIIISIIVTTLVIYTAFRNVDSNYIKVLRTFGATRWQIFTQAILPSSYSVIISACKVNVGLAWVGVIVGEYLVADKGLGYLIIYGFQVFNFTLVMLSLVIICILATLMYQIVAIIEKKVKKHY